MSQVQKGCCSDIPRTIILDCDNTYRNIRRVYVQQHLNETSQIEYLNFHKFKLESVMEYLKNQFKELTNNN